MLSRIPLLTIVISLSLTSVLGASEEESLFSTEVKIVFNADQTVPVVFTAKVSPGKHMETLGDCQEVTIEAFGKRHVLDKFQCAKLNGFPLSSLRVTHEAGYERIGGHTIHFRMKNANDDTVIVSVSKGQGLREPEILPKAKPADPKPAPPPQPVKPAPLPPAKAKEMMTEKAAIEIARKAYGPFPEGAPIEVTFDRTNNRCFVLVKTILKEGSPTPGPDFHALIFIDTTTGKAIGGLGSN